MATQCNATTAMPVQVCVIFDDKRIEDIKATIDACVDAGEASSSKAAKAASTQFFPVVIEYACSLLNRFGFNINSEAWSKPVAAALTENCNPMIDCVSKKSNHVAKASLHKSVDMNARSASFFSGWFKRDN